MYAPIRFVISFIVLCSISLSVKSSSIQKKEVVASVEILPNYLWHIFASSNIWDKDTSLYAQKFGHTVLLQDREFMYNHRKLIAWANGRSGKLTQGIFFYPLRQETTIEEYIAILTRLTDEMKGHVPDEIYQICLEMNAIMERNYKCFEKTVWPDIKPLLEEAKSKLERRFRNSDPISEWEKNLGRPYPENKKVLVLSYANQYDNLPSANDLSSVRNNFGISADESTINYVFDLIVHEIGVYNIKSVIDSLYSDMSLNRAFIRDNNIIYVAFETFIEKRKDEIFETEPRIFLHQWIDQYNWFYDYYKNNDDSRTGIKSLLTNAILAFNTTFNPNNQ